jgi:hypothetical protein
MDRRRFLIAAGAVAATARAGAAPDPGAPAPSTEALESTEELSLQDIATALAGGRLSSQQLTQMYLTRIDRLDKGGPKLNAVSELIWRGLDIAAGLFA